MKNIFLKSIVLVSFIFLSSLNAEDDLFDEDLESLLSMETELKADVGSRSGGRDFLKSLSPVDVVTHEQIDRSGLTSLTDVLRYFVAGFNAPETSVADGTDHTRAFTLRGMSGDQVLVLVNGKRRHTSSLMNVNGTIGRGSSNVDLDAISVRSIEKVEILRDGAAAQYGSDAIAGVINIILKGYGYKNSVSVHGGIRKEGDGEQLQADAFLTASLDYDGFLNLTIDAKGQSQTQRAGYDDRLPPPSLETHVGIPDSKSILSVFNMEAPQKGGTNVYANAILSYKDSEASAFFRDDDNGSNLYPNGFLPMIGAKVSDYSAVVGVEGEVGDGYKWDLSNALGYNNFKFSVDDSMNYALGSASPTSFDNGATSFLQNTTNLDLVKNIDDFKVAGGLEFRYEEYQIKAGEKSSYYDPSLANFENSGSQGFFGFSPDNEVDESRTSSAVYLDITYDMDELIILEGAARYENFSDFGATSNYKLALAYNPLESLMFRTSASTGFRAPSLTQSNYSQSSSFVDSTGSLTNQGTFKPDHAVSQALGAKDLDAESSKHFTVGFVYKPKKSTSFVVDYYYTAVDDRIMLSDELDINDPGVGGLEDIYGVTKARFFTNAVDTLTQGVDVKLNHTQKFVNDSKLNSSIWYNYNKNEVTAFNDAHINRTNSYEQIDRMENGQPKHSLKFLNTYEINKMTYTLNINRFGEYSQVREVNNIDVQYDFEAAWTTDMDIEYKFNDDYKIALGGINVFDVMPNKWDGLSGTAYGTNSIKQYSRYSPFGYSGAYYYVRATMRF